MSTVVYARVPDSLKQALAARAREGGLSLTATAVALLEQGLDATGDERARERERALAASTSELERTRAASSRPKPRLRSPGNASS